MPSIDLNADLAEHDVLTAEDLAVLDHVTSASLACGFHAGNRSVMRGAAEECVARGVVIGAHISYRDRAGFGRTPLEVTSDRLAADVVEQWEVLASEVADAGGTVSYVKPHGALYHRMAADSGVHEVVVDALAPFCTVLVGPAGLTRAAGHVNPSTPGAAAAVGSNELRRVAEGFCDRWYDAEGLLVARHHPEALIEDPDTAAEQARSLVVDQGVVSMEGRWIDLVVETLCIHGDRPGSYRLARAVRETLQGAGVSVQPFVDIVSPSGDQDP